MKLARKIRSHEGRDDLILEYRRFAVNVAAKLVRSMNLPKEMFDELESAGYMGLVEAAERYDASSGHSFKKFAFYRIRGAIIDYLRDSNHLSGKAYKCAQAMQASVDLMEELKYLENEPTIRPRTVEEAKLRLAKLMDIAAKGILTFRMSLCEVKQEVENIPEEGPNLEEGMINSEDSSNLRKFVETLPEKERIIIQEYYFNGKKFDEIGEEYGGMSKSWVSRLHSRALERIKNHYLQADAA